jgi:putative ABC transport system permease protein
VWGVELLVALVPAEVPRLADASVDARVLAFAVGLTAVSVLVAGLAPALMASSPSLTDALAEGPRAHGGSRRHRRLQSLLLGGEAAVALVLLAGAGLLVQTFQNLRHVDLGYDPQRLLTFELSHPRNKYRQPAERRELYRSLVEGIRALPGVEASAMVLLRPLWGEVGLDWPFRVEGQTEAEGHRNPALNLEVVTPDYFRVMRIPVLRGRGFDSRDAGDAPVAIVVSRTLAERYWPGQDPIGKRVEMPLPTAPYPRGWVTVVGVAGDARYRELQQARLDVYLSNLQSDEPMRHVVVRTAGDPLAPAAAIRSAVRALDRDLVSSEMAGMDRLVDRALAGSRFGTQVLSGFALAALLLATLGTYGIVAFAMGWRTREIGVRMALGARPSAVAALVVRQGLTPVVLGLVVGVAAALALGRTLAGLLFEVAPTDAASLGLAAAVLGTSALAACTLPAVRAACIDPARALRED